MFTLSLFLAWKFSFAESIKIIVGHLKVPRLKWNEIEKRPTKIGSKLYFNLRFMSSLLSGGDFDSEEGKTLHYFLDLNLIWWCGLILVYK